MKFFLVPLAAALAFSFSLQNSSEQSAASGSQAQAVRALEEKWLANENDPAALDSILAADFVHALPFGFITKQQQIDFLRAHHFPETSRHFEDLRVRVYGGTAIANGVVVADSPEGGAPQKTVFTDVFVFRGARWQAVNAQENPYAARPQSRP